MQLISKAKISKRKAEIKRLYKLEKSNGGSWRSIADSPLYFDGKISHSVLQRFAKEKDYLPADPALLDVLDLVMKPNPFRNIPKHFNRTHGTLMHMRRIREKIKGMGAATTQALKGKRK